jgi:protein-tyrosine phosphatase
MHSYVQDSAEKSFVRVVDWIDGAINLRDFGGYPTEDGRRVLPGMLYRSGNTHHISAEGMAYLAVQLGIRTVIDLRSPTERSQALSEFEAHGIGSVHEPLETGYGVDPALPREALVRSMALGTFDWVGLYWTLIHHNVERFRRILALLADPRDVPAVIHCAGGRDRTGVAVALIQLALGVRTEDIAEDFALSSQLLELGAPQTEFDRLFGAITDIPRDDIVRAMTTRAETMHALLARIDSTYGSSAGLFSALGVAPALLVTLRDQLTVAGSGSATPRIA